MAKIVFSDGSKQLAHNLDDLYERWHIRRESMSEVDQRHDVKRFEDMIIPQVDISTLTVDECKAHVDYLLSMKVLLNEKILHKRQEIQKYVDDHVYRSTVAEIRAMEHLDYRAGYDINVASKRVGVLQIDNPSMHMYSDFIRASLRNIIESTSDPEMQTMLTKLADHRFRRGDKPLFRKKDTGHE